MSQQSVTAHAPYERLRSAPYPRAYLVRELRAKWGAEHGVLSVHRFVPEVAACLLDQADVEVGDLQAGRFVPWLEPWDADERIERELIAMTAFLDDEARYIFRRNWPNQQLEPTAGTESALDFQKSSSFANTPGGGSACR